LGNATFYLYARGKPVAELVTGWSYYLSDGLNVPRQMSDGAGMVTLMREYTPWGEVLKQAGTGNFTWGYFGGLMDAATGLLYVGGGQYYDPATGRFLTPANRGSNPYLPGRIDPTAGLLGSATLLALVFRRCRKPGKYDTLVVTLVLAFGLGIGLAGCGGGDVAPTNTCTPPSLPPTGTAMATAESTQATATATRMPTPEPTSTPVLIGEFILSAYYIPTEEQYRNSGGAKVPIPAVQQRSIDIVGDPNITLYLSKTHKYDYEWNTDNLQTAIWGFLYDTREGICMQGSGKLDSGEYISCTAPQGTALEDVRFDWQLSERVDRLENSVAEFETIAVAPALASGPLPFGTQIEIPELAPYLQSYNADATLTVTDTGEGLDPAVSGEMYQTLDLFVGEGQPGLDAYYQLIRAYPKTKPVKVYRK
jgi:RHS repeat-associated protein